MKKNHPEIVALGEPLLEFNAMESGPLRNIRRYEVGFGGDVSNFLIAVGRMGGNGGMICHLGDDEFGQIFLKLWRDEGIDVSHVNLIKGLPTGIYFISRRGADHSFTYYRNGSAASTFGIDDVPVDYISRAKIFHASGISQAISNSACDAVFHAMDVARSHGVLISYDPNVRLKLWSLRRARAIILEAIGYADFVLPSLEDAKFLVGDGRAEDMAQKLLNKGPRAVVLKMGSAGALLASRDGIHRFDPLPLEVADTTGAGDAFDGAFIATYLKGHTLEESARFANAAATLTTRSWGAVNSIPRFDEVVGYLESSDRPVFDVQNGDKEHEV